MLYSKRILCWNGEDGDIYEFIPFDKVEIIENETRDVGVILFVAEEWFQLESESAHGIRICFNNDVTAIRYLGEEEDD